MQSVTEPGQHTIRRSKGTLASVDLLNPEVVSALMHKIGHEIGNPLTSIISLAAILSRFSSVPAGAENKTPHYANSISAEAWKISRISDMLVMLFSQQVGHPAPTEIGPALQRALAKLKTRTHLNTDPIVVRFETPGSPIALVDSEQFIMLCAELIANALQSTVELRADPTPPVEVTVRSDKTLTQIEFRNKVAQPNPHELETLFRPMVSAFEGQKHLGIGLSMAQAILSRSSGEIELVETVSADGTVEFRVTLSLPNSLNSHPDPISSSSSTDEPVSAQASSILVVEDQAMVSSAIKKILEFSFKGSRAVQCRCVSGSEALELFKSGELFDGVLCDINLSPLNGGDVFAAACKINPAYQKRFAFMTGGGRTTGDPSEIGTLHNRPCLAKPFEPEQLIGLVSELLSRVR